MYNYIILRKAVLNWDIYSIIAILHTIMTLTSSSMVAVLPAVGF